MKTLAVAILLLIPLAANSAETKKPAAESQAAEQPADKAPGNESVDISDLENDYWRPNKDKLEVVENRRFEKKGRFEVAAQYGIYQGEDFENTTSYGGTLTYNFTNMWFVEGSYMKVKNQDNQFVQSLRSFYNFRPDFNRESEQEVLSVGWVPIYAKFSLLGQKISHFELYVAPGIGMTKTADTHTSAHFTVGNKFYITEHMIFRVDWRMTRYEDQITVTQGTQSRANGGPGYVKQTETTHNIIFGLGWMF